MDIFSLFIPLKFRTKPLNILYKKYYSFAPFRNRMSIMRPEALGQ